MNFKSYTDTKKPKYYFVDRNDGIMFVYILGFDAKYRIIKRKRPDTNWEDFNAMEMQFSGVHPKEIKNYNPDSEMIPIYTDEQLKDEMVLAGI